MGDAHVSFSAPPVVEVVAGVSLDGLGPETGPLLTAFWAEQVRKLFPRLEQQPPYLPPVEQFPSGGGSFKLQLNIGAPPTRLWAMTQDGAELIQLQPGWFACNWRKVQRYDEYDRWPQRRAAFERWFKALCDFLVREGVGEPKVTQCEVTYVNHVRAGGAWQQHGEFQRVFRVEFGGQLTHPLEQVSAEAQFVLEGEGQHRGRLHAKVIPAYDRDGKTPLYVLELTARGRPDGDGLSGALRFLDYGRDAINDSFVALTTDVMHHEWGREA